MPKDYFAYLDTESGGKDYFSYLDQEEEETRKSIPKLWGKSALHAAGSLVAGLPLTVAGVGPHMMGKAAGAIGERLPGGLGAAATGAGEALKAPLRAGLGILGKEHEAQQELAAEIQERPWGERKEISLPQEARRVSPEEFARDPEAARAKVAAMEETMTVPSLAEVAIRGSAYVPEILGGWALKGAKVLARGTVAALDASAIKKAVTAPVPVARNEAVRRLAVMDIEPVGPAAREALRGHIDSKTLTSLVDDATVFQIKRVDELAGKAAEKLVKETVASGKPVMEALSARRIGDMPPPVREAYKDRAEVALLEEVRKLPDLPIKTKKGVEEGPKRSWPSLYLREGSARPETIMDGVGPELKTVWESIGIEGHRVAEGVKHAHRAAYVEAAQRAIGFEPGTRKFQNWMRVLVEVPGLPRMTRGEAIDVIAMVKDPDNAAAILRGGLVLKRDPTKTAHRVNPETIERLRAAGFAGPEDELAQFGFDRMAVFAKEINPPTERVFGKPLAVREDYYPRTVDFSTRGGKELRPFQNLHDEATLMFRHMRPREGANLPVEVVSFGDKYANYTDGVARIAGYLEPGTTALDMLRRPAYRSELVKKIGEGGYNRIVDSIEMQILRRQDPSRFEGSMRRGLRRFSTAVLGLRLGPLFLNPSGLMVSASYQPGGFKNLAGALASEGPGAIGQAVGISTRVDDLAKKYTPYWTTRYGDYPHQVTSGMTPTAVDAPKSVFELGLVPLQRSDKFGAHLRWGMAERHIDNTMPSLAKGSDDYYGEVAREWERLMFRGENTAHGMEMSGVLAAGKRNPAIGAMTMFTSSVSKIYSLLPRAQNQLKRGDYSGAIQSLAGFVGAVTWSAGARNFVKVMRGKYQDDRSVTENMTKAMLEEAAGYPPILGDIAKTAVRTSMGEASMSFPMSAIENLGSEAQRIPVTVAAAVQATLDDDYNALGDRAFVAKWGKAFDQMAEFGSKLVGAPYPGLKDFANAMRVQYEALKGEAPDLAKALREVEEDTDVKGQTRARRKLLGSIKNNDSEKFRSALLEMRSAGIEVTSKEVVATIRRRSPYKAALKYEPRTRRGEETNKKRLEASTDALEVADLILEEMREMIEAANSLAAENGDLLKGFAGGETEYLETLRLQPTRPFSSRR